jgi:outer membrane immunogenic protein
MHLKCLVAGVLIAMATPVVAADLAPAPVEPIAPAATPFNWGGFYVGAAIGYQFNDVEGTYFNRVFTAPSIDADADGIIGGAYAGYNFQFGQFVLGVEADIEAASGSGDGEDPILNAFFDVSENWQGSVRARVGYAIDRFLPYLTAGVAYSDWDVEGGTVIAPTTTIDYSEHFTGWTVGGGAEYAFTDNLIGRIEYRYTDFGDAGSAIPIPPGAAKLDLDSSTARLGVAYKF